nr:hypothetical protein [Mycoplasmopsis bovis]
MKIDNVINQIINKNWSSVVLNDKNVNNLNSILKTYSLNFKNFKSKLIEAINSKFNKTEQFSLLRSIDDLLLIRQNETNYLFINDYEKIIVQYFYTKPLNDSGFTYYQDITVFN